MQQGQDGNPRISADMSAYWKFNEGIYNWPFFEVSISMDDISLKTNNFLNEVFFKNYNQNPYYWELAWDTSPNIDSLIFRSTASRISLISNPQFWSITQIDDLTRSGISIKGDNSNNKFFGGTNYADTMYGGSGDDEYWPFSGMNFITDLGGSNTYHFYTHNMRGTTTILDLSKIGKIQFVNIGCGIGKAYKIDVGTPGAFVFFPVLDKLCNLAKYSSGIVDSLTPSIKEKVNHKTDVILLSHIDADLQISYNNNAFFDQERDKILIKSFNNGDFGIFINKDEPEAENKYIAVGGDENNYFTCSTEEDSILAGLGGNNFYYIPLFNSKNCDIIGSNQDSNIYSLFSKITRFLSNEDQNNSTVITNIFGLKNIDILDFSSIGFSSLSDLPYDFKNKSSIIKIPGGLNLNLDNVDSFLATLNGVELAFYNTSANTYTTDLESVGINITEIYDTFLNTFAPSLSPSQMPTVIPTEIDSGNIDEQYSSGLNQEAIIGLVIGGVVLAGIGGYALVSYAKWCWPFSSAASIVPTHEIEVC